MRDKSSRHRPPDALDGSHKSLLCSLMKICDSHALHQVELRVFSRLCEVSILTFVAGSPREVMSGS